MKIPTQKGEHKCTELSLKRKSQIIPYLQLIPKSQAMPMVMSNSQMMPNPQIPNKQNIPISQLYCFVFLGEVLIVHVYVLRCMFVYYYSFS